MARKPVLIMASFIGFICLDRIFSLDLKASFLSKRAGQRVQAAVQQIGAARI